MLMILNDTQKKYLLQHWFNAEGEDLTIFRNCATAAEIVAKDMLVNTDPVDDGWYEIYWDGEYLVTLNCLGPFKRAFVKMLGLQDI